MKDVLQNQNQPMKDVLQNSSPATVLKQLKWSVQEFIESINGFQLHLGTKTVFDLLMQNFQCITAQKMKFSKDFLSKCDQIQRKL